MREETAMETTTPKNNGVVYSVWKFFYNLRHKHNLTEDGIFGLGVVLGLLMGCAVGAVMTKIFYCLDLSVMIGVFYVLASIMLVILTIMSVVTAIECMSNTNPDKY